MKDYLIERYGSRVIAIHTPINGVSKLLNWLQTDDRILSVWQPNKEEVDIEVSKRCEEEDIAQLISDIKDHIVDGLLETSN